VSETGARRPRTKPGSVRREELLDAAERLFLERGVAGTSIDEVVAAAGVAKGTFYLYFASKDKILAALQERYVGTFHATLAAAMERRRPDDFPGRLDAWVKAAVDDQLDRVALHTVVFHDAHIRDRNGESPVISQLADLLIAGARAGAWNVADAGLTAIMLFHALHGAVDDRVMAAQNVNRRQLIGALRKFFRSAVMRGSDSDA
jgi:AcrR family transcriptional regulator